MTAERWTSAVRRQLGLGRLLPLGEAEDGAWIAERAAEAVLRRAVGQGEPGVRLDRVRIALADPEAAGEPAVPPPPSALPPGPLRLTVEFAARASAAEPLPSTGARLRAVLAEAARERIGLALAEVDLRVTDLLDTEPEPQRAADAPDDAGDAEPVPAPAGSDEARIAAAALAVPGVSRLTGTFGRPVHLTESPGTAALPRRHARVNLATRADHRAVDVTRTVRTTISSMLPDHLTVAVLITSID